MRAARTLRLALPAAVLALAAACGGDDDGGGGSDEEPAPRQVSGGEPTGPANEGIDGVEAFEVTSADHTEDELTYDPQPPVGGEHNPVPATCGFYESDPPAESHIVHSLEHGAIWIAYRPDLPEAQITTLSELAGDEPKLLVTPEDELPSPVVVSAWARQLELESADDPRLASFIQQYRAGGEAPEPQAACQGMGAPTVVSPGS